MKNIVLAFIVLFPMMFSGNLSAQYTLKVNACEDSSQIVALVDTVLLGNIPSIYKKNITFRGSPASVGYYFNGSLFGFDNNRGMVMTTGEAELADNPNICNSQANASVNNDGVESEPDLVLMSNSTIHDAAVVEFDVFLTADSMSLDYVFASEEYHEYVFSTFNDVFGFFLSGNPINGPYSNNADLLNLVPDSYQFVYVNTINFGMGGQTCTGKPSGCTNCEYMKDNSQRLNPAFNQLVYDGYTTPLEGSHAIVNNLWYHVKLAIGDAGDPYFDSGIFLKKNFLTQYTYAGVKSTTEEPVTIYPNPASDYLTVILPDNMKPAELSIKDMQGRTFKTLNAAPGNIPIELMEVPKGINILEVKTDDSIKHYKFIHR